MFTAADVRPGLKILHAAGLRQEVTQVNGQSFKLRDLDTREAGWSFAPVNMLVSAVREGMVAILEYSRFSTEDIRCGFHFRVQGSETTYTVLSVVGDSYDYTDGQGMKTSSVGLLVGSLNCGTCVPA